MVFTGSLGFPASTGGAGGASVAEAHRGVGVVGYWWIDLGVH